MAEDGVAPEPRRRSVQCSSRKGLHRIAYLEWGDPRNRDVLVCVHGLTRSSRDFDALAAALCAQFRVVCPDLAGRGDSERLADPALYVLPQYVSDMVTLVARLDVEQVSWLGTSLGGLITMLLASANPTRLAGAVLNDIGPELETSGLDNIRSYVGRARDWPTWLHAARFIAEAQADRYPDWGIDEWLVYAKRLCKLTPSGRIVYDYDMRIAEPFKLPGGETGFDLWPLFKAMAGTPTLLLRGELSDLLSEATVERMKAVHPKLEVATVPRVGHAPTLDEPEASKAIDRLLKRIAAKGT